MATRSKIIPAKKANPQQNPVKAVIRRYGSDSFKYCEKDRFTIVEGEPMHGGEGVDRIIFFYCPMKWSDSEKQLNATERKKVFQTVGEYLDKKKIKWKFSYWR
ncbi:MAG TPA: hypothetical protein VH280_16965 [Verrucomicrobiae bacterium]|jgi:hypothetical protein|nr:hypothetical protein [Verrucomicrobiae bacterium]